jgi:hypothetical protein
MLFLFFTAVFETAAQSTTDSQAVVAFDMTGFPQWAKDLRRWEIVAFGAFPIAMGVSGIGYNMYLDNNRGNNLSANERFQTTVLIAVGISAAVAFADLIIVKVKQYRERRRIESLPSGSVIIETRPQDSPQDDPRSGAEDQPEAGVNLE